MSESLSVEAAVAEMNASEPEEAAPTPEVAPVDDGGDPGDTDNEIETLPVGDDGDGAETPTDDDSAETPEPETAIEAPHFWSAEQKAKFAALPADMQQYVLDNDRQAQRTVSARLEEAANARKAADAEAQTFKALADKIATVAERADETFADRWSGFTPQVWADLAREDPTRYTQLKAQHEADRDAVQQAKTARDAVQQVERAKWVTEQEERLKTLAPELADPVKGSANRGAVAEYLKSNGVAEQDLENVGALEVSIAWKAMQYDKSLTALKSKPAAERAPVRPAAAAQSSSQNSALANAEARFRKTGSMEDALRVMNLKG